MIRGAKNIIFVRGSRDDHLQRRYALSEGTSTHAAYLGRRGSVLHATHGTRHRVAAGPTVRPPSWSRDALLTRRTQLRSHRRLYPEPNPARRWLRRLARHCCRAARPWRLGWRVSCPIPLRGTHRMRQAVRLALQQAPQVVRRAVRRRAPAVMRRSHRGRTRRSRRMRTATTTATVAPATTAGGAACWAPYLAERARGGCEGCLVCVWCVRELNARGSV